MPDIEDQLRDRMEALTQAQERQGSAEERTQRLESQLEEKTADLMKLTQRLKKNEEHNQRLSQTVDKLLSGKNTPAMNLTSVNEFYFGKMFIKPHVK